MQYLKREGQRARCKRRAAAELARSLGIPGLSRLSSADAELLAQAITFLCAQARQGEFDEGWRACEKYNSDVEYLAQLPATATGH